MPGERILLVDDDPGVLQVATKILTRAGYTVHGISHAQEALGKLAQEMYQLVVSDVRMPGMSGLELLERIKAQNQAFPVALITGNGSMNLAVEAIAKGVDGLILKPFTPDELLSGVERAMGRYRLLQENIRYRMTIPLLNGLISALANAVEAKDAGTGDHCGSLVENASHLARSMGYSEEDLEAIRWGALLHDVGKIGIPDAVLLKPGPLTEEEWQIMRGHPGIGAKIIASVPELEKVIPLVRHHHEHYDGGGYPNGLKGEEIPAGARIISVVDAYLAMRQDRPYRRGMDIEDVRKIMLAGSGKLWDPKMVAAWLELAGREEVVRSVS